MKIQLDTTSKTIRVEETVNLGSFYKLLELILPDGKWKEFKLETQVTVNWINPIVVEPYRPYTPPWWEQPWITYKTTDAVSQYSYSLKDGIFNLDS